MIHCNVKWKDNIILPQSHEINICIRIIFLAGLKYELYMLISKVNL